MTIREEIKQRLEIQEPSEYPNYEAFCAAVVTGRDKLTESVRRALFSHMALAIMGDEKLGGQ